MERPRRRSSRSPASRRLSRSPMSRRYSPRRRSRTRSRSLEKRTRKRSPFINELARQLRNEANTSGYVPPATMEGIAPLLNLPTYKQEEARPQPPAQPPPLPPPPPPVAPPYVHQSGSLPPPPPPSSSSAMLPPMPSGPFMNFEPIPATVPLMNFEPVPPTPNLTPANYSSGPVMYNQPNATIQAPSPSVMCSPLLPMSSPQPVPPPAMDRAHVSYNPSYTVPFQQSPIQPPNKPLNHSTTPSTSSQNYTEHGPTTSSYNEAYSPQQERIKTPEPPIISKKPKVIAIHIIVMNIWF